MAEQKVLNPNVPEELYDLRNFLFLTWTFLWESGAITAPRPDPTPVQYDLAYYLQHGERRKVIEAFRGVGKSWITSAYVCWRLLLNPHLNFLVVSASKDRSDQFSTFTKRLIYEFPLLEGLIPQRGQRDSNLMFDVGPAGISHSPSVKSVGITGQLTGSRADEIIADDVESLNNSLTHTLRYQLSERIKEFDAILKPGGVITYLGTPQTEMSIYNDLGERGYSTRVWPARIPDNDGEAYSGKLAPMVMDMMARGSKVRDPVDPDRFSDTDLLEREASYGRSGFALQFMLDTTLSDSDRYPLRLKDLMCLPLDNERAPIKFAWASSPENIVKEAPNVGLTGDSFYRPMWHANDTAEYTGSFMFIDPAGRGKDETAYAVVKMLHGWLFVHDVGGFSGGYNDSTLKGLAMVAAKYKVNEIWSEPNFGDGMFNELLRPVLRKIHPCTLDEGPRASQQKERRMIDVLEPVMNQHKLIIDERLIKKDMDNNIDNPRYSLFYQMTRLTADKGSLPHDDRLDALSGAVAYWVEQMAQDGEKSAADHLAREFDSELEKFKNNILGKNNSDSGPNWIGTMF